MEDAYSSRARASNRHPLPRGNNTSAVIGTVRSIPRFSHLRCRQWLDKYVQSTTTGYTLSPDDEQPLHLIDDEQPLHLIVNEALGAGPASTPWPWTAEDAATCSR